VLLEHGVADLPITLTQMVINKAVNKKHDVSVKDLKDIVMSVQSPIAIFKDKAGSDTRIIVTEIRHSDGNVIAVIRMNTTRDGLEINDIRSIHPKRDSSIAYWVGDGLLLGLEKDKGRKWLENSVASNSRQPQVSTTFDDSIIYDSSKMSSVSKVVDDNGEPLVVYHGTQAESFNEFSENSYFTNKKETAERYSDQLQPDGIERTPNVYEVFLNIKKIKEMPMFSLYEDYASQLKKRGVNGTIAPMGNSGAYEFVVQSPNQIKSATDNTGAFSESGDIRFSKQDGDTETLETVSGDKSQLHISALTAPVLKHEAVEIIVNETRRKLALFGDLPINTISTESDLPAHIIKQAEKDGATGEIKAVYDPHTKTVYIVADRMTSRQNIEEAIAHEALGHYGVRVLLGKDVKKAFNQSGMPMFMTHWRDKIPSMKSVRNAWGDFPEVVLLSKLGSAKNHQGYEAAKGGDMDAALDVVNSIITEEKIEEIHRILQGRKPILAPVIADELSGENKLPIAYASILSEKLGLQVDNGIVQIVRAYHTDAGAFHRIAINPIFEGEIVEDQDYLIIDDTLAMGGTVTSLKGYIEINGGRVILASTLTGYPAAANIVVKENMIQSLRDKHGDELEEYLKKELEYGIEKLTQGEAGHIKATPSVDELRKRIVEAKREAGRDESSRRNTFPAPKDQINPNEPPSSEGVSDSEPPMLSRSPSSNNNEGSFSTTQELGKDVPDLY